MTTFKVGDAIVHPVRGAGIVVRLMKWPRHGDNKTYYRVELLTPPGTSLMIPTSAVEALGLRHAIPQSKLGKVWRVLRVGPEKLPDDHKERYKLLEDKFHTGDILQVAEAVRDMNWRQRRQRRLTTKGKQLYEKGMNILAGEIAATRDVGLDDAQAQVREKLREIQDEEGEFGT